MAIETAADTTTDPSHSRATTLAAQRRALPDQPGVYLFRDERGRVIYVGKAVSIRKRVASHFSRAQVPSSPGHAEMVASVAHVDCVVVASEAEALLTEQGFIKQYRPRFNIRLRDDKSYPFIAISLDEDYPRVYFTRERHRPGRAYYGPYSNAKRVRATLEVLAKVFMFRSCTGPEPGRRSGSPCLDYYIKRCTAPCVEYISREDYRASIEQVGDFLSGRFVAIERDLETRMRAAAAAEEFEQATLERNRLRAVHSLLERRRVATPRPVRSTPWPSRSTGARPTRRCSRFATACSPTGNPSTCPTRPSAASRTWPRSSCCSTTLATCRSRR